jgi:predicted Zn-dependent peptidase
MNFIGTDKMDAKAFKKAMSKLGVSYRFHLDNDVFTVELSGLEDNAKEAIALLNDLMNNPKVDEAKYKLFISDEKLELKQLKGDPSSLAQIGRNYLYYGKYSKYLTGQSVSDLSKIKPETLIPLIKQAMSYPLSIHYVGKTQSTQVLGMFKDTNFKYPTDYSKITVYHPRPLNKSDKPKIYVLYRKDARQSHLMFFADGAKFNKDSIPRQQAFNSYFGGDMSSLVFQEVREFRSLAYAATMVYSQAKEASADNSFVGYIGCQGDKTKDALSTSMDLLKNMPEKPDRIESIREGLIDADFASRPGFRDLSTSVEHWMDMGYFMDPAAYNLSFYSKLTFDDITSFYRNRVKPLPVSMFIVGNKASVPIEELKKMGDVIIVKEKDILKQ